MQDNETLIGEIKDVIWWLDGYLSADTERQSELGYYHIKALKTAIDIIIKES